MDIEQYKRDIDEYNKERHQSYVKKLLKLLEPILILDLANIVGEYTDAILYATNDNTFYGYKSFDMKEGLWFERTFSKLHHHDCSVKRFGEYVNGKRTGLWRIWKTFTYRYYDSFDSVYFSENEYINNKITKWRKFRTDGTLYESGYGIKPQNGSTIINYYTDENIFKKREYYDDNKCKTTTYYPNGTINTYYESQRFGEDKNALVSGYVRHGRSYQNYKHGYLKSETDYVRGKMSGKHKTYDKHGCIMSDRTFVDGKLSGTSTIWRDHAGQNRAYKTIHHK